MTIAYYHHRPLQAYASIDRVRKNKHMPTLILSTKPSLEREKTYAFY